MLGLGYVLVAALASGHEVVACPLESGETPAVTTAVGMEYPRLAVASRLEGSFDVCLAVDAQGVPLRAEIQDASPKGGVFKQAAEAAALQWRFARSEKLGELRSVRIRFTFVLCGDRNVHPGPIFHPPYEVEIRMLPGLVQAAAWYR